MRDRMLHDAMRELTEDAAGLLDGRLAAGEEIPFEVGETAHAPAKQKATTLYAYRPLTAEFVATHAQQLRSLATFDHAVDNLARTHGAVAYLRSRGEPVLEVSTATHARLAVLAFLATVWQDAESFCEFDERFERAYRELESVVLAARLVTTAFVPVHGVVIETDEVNLGDGVRLVAPDELSDDCLARFADEPRAADCYCAVSIDAPSDAPLPVAELRHEARCALTSLRLFKPGSVSFGLTAQSEVAGAWQVVTMPFSGRAREESWRLLDGEDEELRQFMAAVRRVEKRTRTSWALKRFEMGLERTVPAEGLTDFLAAARALLDAGDDAGRRALPARIAALCAREQDRERVAGAVECAFALESLAISGSAGREARKQLAASTPLETIAEVEGCLRALLHDLVCGYLDSDLKRIADEILLADGQAGSVEEAIEREAGFAGGFYRPADDLAGDLDGPAARASTVEFDSVFDDTAEIAAADLREPPTASDVPPGPAGLSQLPPPGPIVDAAPSAEPTPGSQDGPGDEWTERVLSDDPQWWTPERSRAKWEAREADGLDTRQADGAAGEQSEHELDSDTDTDADAFEQTTQSYPELDAGARMNQLAEDLVDSFDRAFTETMADDGEPSERERDPEREARMSFTSPGEADLTFDFPVLAGESTPPGGGRTDGVRPAGGDAPRPPFDGPQGLRDLSPSERIDFLQKHSGLTGEFPVPEFDLPDRVRHERLRELLGDRTGDTSNFGQIMSTSYPEPHGARPGAEAAALPAQPQVDADDGFERPRLVALRGGAAPATSSAPADEQPPATPDVTTPAPAGPATPSLETPATVDPGADVDHGQARAGGIGPATIEFRPLVDADPDDPDDFAGAC